MSSRTTLEYFTDVAIGCLNQVARDKAFRKQLTADGPELIGALLRRTTPMVSLRALAREVGLSAPYLCDVIYGRRTLSPTTFVRLVNVLKGNGSED